MKKRLKKKTIGNAFLCAHSKMYEEVHDEVPESPIEFIEECKFGNDCSTCKAFYVSKKTRTVYNKIMKMERKKYLSKSWNWDDED